MTIFHQCISLGIGISKQEKHSISITTYTGQGLTGFSIPAHSRQESAWFWGREWIPALLNCQTTWQSLPCCLRPESNVSHDWLTALCLCFVLMSSAFSQPFSLRHIREFKNLRRRCRGKCRLKLPTNLAIL